MSIAVATTRRLRPVPPSSSTVARHSPQSPRYSVNFRRVFIGSLATDAVLGKAVLTIA
jgi:hypothetical protein